jgi:hypothetical protein
MVKHRIHWRRGIALIGISVVGVVGAVCACPPKQNGQVAVTTAAAAILTARQSWESLYEKLHGRNAVYGKQATAKFEPYTATLKEDVWLVRGTIPPGFQGETIETTICQSDGSASLVVVEIR